MSTQDQDGILFEMSNNQQGFRFLELLPALLEAIISPNPPNLFLKSHAPSSYVDQPNGNAVLCTDSQTFQIRQVQSSNSVLVAEPSQTQEADEGDAIPTTSLRAIAQCTATLELMPSSSSATSHLQRRLPQYAGLSLSTVDKEHSVTLEGNTVGSRASILEDTPFSKAEVDEAWTNLCAFNLQGKSFRPTAISLIAVWKSIMSAIVLRSINIEEGIVFRMIVGSVEEDGYATALIEAVLFRLVQEGVVTKIGEIIIDRAKTIQWVGESLLEAQTPPSRAILVQAFVQEWRELLPESWRKKAHLKLLEGTYSQPSKNTLVFNKTQSGQQLQPEGKMGMTSGKASRKWHEKFMKSRT